MGWNAYSIYQAKCKKDDAHLPKAARRSKQTMKRQYRNVSVDEMMELFRDAASKTGPATGDSASKKESAIKQRIQALIKEIEVLSFVDKSSYLFIRRKPSSTESKRKAKPEDYIACIRLCICLI